jgi:glucans biosynthesis protein C
MERIYAFDSLRSIMMLLGIVIHSALTYSSNDYSNDWPIKDLSSNHIFFDYIVALIHLFRMPVFFLVSGFFGAMLFYKRSPLSMLKNRFKRIFMPFLIFLFALMPIIIFSFSFSYATFNGENPLIFSIDHVYKMSLIPKQTYHLWFLYYLMLISFFTFCLANLVNLSTLIKIVNIKYVKNIFNNPLLQILICSFITFLILYFAKNEWINNQSGLIPDINVFIFYQFFYLYGWILFLSKYPLQKFMVFDRYFLLVGFSIFSLSLLVIDQTPLLLKSGINAIAIWLFIFGILGLFLRHANKQLIIFNYISESSYWIYIVHLPIVGLVPGLIANWPLATTVKFLLVIIMTFLIGITSYRYFVRSTFIGEFLNGKRYPNNKKIVQKENMLIDNIN